MTARKIEAIRHIKEKDDLYLTPQEIAPVLDADPNTLLLTARERPGQLMIPHTFVGKRLIFPKRAFIEFMGIE